MSKRQPCRLARAGFFALAISVLLGGCAALPPPAVTPEPPVPAEVPAPPVEIPVSQNETPVPEPVAPPPEPEPAPIPSPEPTRVSILLSDDIPLLVSVVDQIKQRLGDHPHTVHNLDGHPANLARIVEEIEESDPDQLVTLGLLAAQVGRQLDTIPMVFCYVFNYEEHDLVSTKSKGVNLLPPFEMQLEVWKTFSPDLNRVGVIAGPNQDALITEIERAAENIEIELLSRTVNSDQEALYDFQRLTPEIQGLWLLPDNRILSPRVVGEIMTYAEKHRIQVIVFSDRMLDMGGLMAISAREGDVADQIEAQLDNRTADGQLNGPDMMPLTQMDLNINPIVARRLGLIPLERSARSEPRP